MAKQGESPPDIFPAHVLGEDGKIVGASIEVTQKPGVTQDKRLVVGVRVEVPGFHVGEMLKWTWLAPTGELVEPSLLLSAGDGKMMVLELPTGWSELSFRFILCQRSSEELMLRVRDFDDETSYNVLYHRHSRKIWYFFMWRTGNRADTEDLTQEVWVKVWARRHTFKEGNKFTSWFWAITRHTWIDRLRRRQIQTVSLDIEQVDWFTAAFARAWGRLSPEEQDRLRKIHWEGRMRKEVAAESDSSLPTSRKRKREAEEKLGRHLAEEGISVEPLKPEEKKLEEVKEQGSQETPKEADQE